MFQRLKLLRRLQEVPLSPEEAWALLERVKTPPSRAEDRERFAHLIRATTEVTEQLRAEPNVPTPSVSQRLSSPRHAKRTRQLGAAARRRQRRYHCQYGRACQGAVGHTPPEHVTLSAAEGEALIGRVPASGLCPRDCQVVEQVIRAYCWVVFALQEAKLSVQRLRRLLFGKGPMPEQPPAPEASSTSSAAVGKDEGGSEVGLIDQETPGSEVAGGAEGSERCDAEASPKPPGGHRAGTGRLRADASVGAERTECRHEELAVGQRCPVCGQGTFYE